MNINNLKSYIILLCFLDYYLTIIGINIGYIKEVNPIFNYFFIRNEYAIGLIYKLLLTIIGLQALDNYREILQAKLLLTFILSLYLSINTTHIIYIILEIITNVILIFRC